MFWRNKNTLDQKFKHLKKWWPINKKQDGSDFVTIDFTENAQDAFAYNFSELRDVIIPGSRVDGKLHYGESVCINGEYNGQCVIDGDLIVGPAAKLSAEISCKNLIVYGNCSGLVYAESRIIVCQGGKLTANVSARNLILGDGGFYKGDCHYQSQQGGTDRARQSTPAASNQTARV